MNGLYNFIIKPKYERYTNKKSIGGSELILNTELQNHKYVSREAVIVALPLAIETELLPNDEIVIHHNIFRRFHDIKGIEKDSRSYFRDDLYLANEDQIYLFKRNNIMKTTRGFYFVKPLENTDMFSLDDEKPLKGVIKYSNDSNEVPVKIGDTVGFRPTSEFEFIINGERLYRVPEKSITILYEHTRNEREYNPSWA